MRNPALLTTRTRSQFPAILCASAAALIVAVTASAETYTYTPTNTSSDLWSAGSNWVNSLGPAVPVSAADTRLTFGDNFTFLPESLTNTNTNDIGQFQLNILDLQGLGLATSAATININSSSFSNGLTLVTNGTTTPVVNLDALAGDGGLAYNVNSTVTLANDTLFTGSGTAAFNFKGGITGTGATFTKSGLSDLNLSGTSSLGSMNVGVNSTGGKVTVGTGGSLTIGSGTGNLSIGVTTTNTAASGTLDVAAADYFFANVATIKVGAAGNNGVVGAGTLNLSASNDLTATTSFVIGESGGAYNSGQSTVTTAASGMTTIRTPVMTIGGNKSMGQFTLGAGSTLQITGTVGVNNGRAAMVVGSTTAGGGSGAWTGTADFSAGVFSGNLSSLLIGNRTVTSSKATEVGTMILGTSDLNHLEVNGTSATYGGVVTIGRAAGATGESGFAEGTLTIGNLDFSSQIVASNANGTAILLGVDGGTATVPITGTGTLNLNGGMLGITTTGSAIAGGTGTSIVNFNGTVLRAGASSGNWISNLDTANVAAGGAKFDTNGFNVAIGQSFTGEGALTKSGFGQLTLSGTNTYSGGTFVEGGLLFLTTTAALPDFATPGKLTIADGAGLGVNIGGAGEFTLEQLEIYRTNGTFQGTAHNLAIGTANAGGDVLYTSSLNTLGSLTKSGANKLTLDNNPTILGGVTIGVNDASGTLAADSGAPFSIGSGGMENLTIGTVAGPTNSSGVVDLSAATSATINVSTIQMGISTSGAGTSQGTLILPAANTITASTAFVIGASNNTFNTPLTSVTTGAEGLTTIRTSSMRVSEGKSNASFILGAGSTLDLAGYFEGDRTALIIANNTAGGSGNWTGTVDLSQGIFKGSLSSLILGQKTNTSSGNAIGSLLLSNNAANHLDVSGFSNPVVIGRQTVSTGGVATGTLTLGNLDSTSSITALDDSTAILIGTGGAAGTVRANGTLNLDGGTLTITTAGTAIGGDTVNTSNISTVNFNGTTLKAGAASTNWISDITNANVSAGGAKFDTNGHDITIPQGFVHDSALTGADGGLTKSGAGVLALTGANTYTGETTVNAGTLLVSGSLSGTAAVNVNNSGSTLRLGANDVLNDLADLSLNNATLETLGFSETLGTLSLAGNATIDMGSGASILQFAGSASEAWTGTLSITNWSGSQSGSGADQLFFGNQAGGLSLDQLALIKFVDPVGFAPGAYDAQILPSGELAVVPEPGSAALLLAGMGLLGMRRRRK